MKCHFLLTECRLTLHCQEDRWDCSHQIFFPRCVNPRHACITNKPNSVSLKKLTLHLVPSRPPVVYLTKFAAILGTATTTAHFHPRHTNVQMRSGAIDTMTHHLRTALPRSLIHGSTTTLCSMLAMSSSANCPVRRLSAVPRREGNATSLRRMIMEESKSKRASQTNRPSIR